MDSIIELHQVTRHYRRGSEQIKALDKIDLRIGAGEFVAVTGASGSGKSTLLNIIGAIDKPSSGTVTLAGKDTSALNDAGLAALRANTIGFVFQQFFLQPTLTALENVLLPTLFGSKKGRSEEHAKALLSRVGLEGRTHHLPSQLSGGEMQRVAIARALINEPKLLLTDEPTGNLDSHTAQEIFALLDELHNSGLTIVVVTHSEALAACAERRIVMRDGAFVTQAEAA